MKKRTILSSILAIALCLSMVVGGTFALFTSESSVNISISSGKVKVVASIDESKIDIYSPTLINMDGTIKDETNAAVYPTFKNGGTVDYVENETGAALTLTNITPGDEVNFEIDVENQSNVTILYRTVISAVEGGIDGLIITINGEEYTGKEVKTAWALVGIDATIKSIPVSIKFDTKAEKQAQSATLAISVEAVQGNTNIEEEIKEATVATAAELQTILTSFTDAGSGNGVINISDDITLAEGETWTPVKIDGYNGAGVITINGNGHTISGLNDTLLAGGFAGNSGIVINDLTIADAKITSSNAQGYGAFINCIDSMPKIELNNCHLKDSTITDTLGARVGGLIGWSAGYNNPNDGPVDTYITIKDCSVTGCTITAAGSVGAIIGHAGNNPATFHTITNCKVENNTLTSNDEGYRVGAIVGTANVGEVTITGCTSVNNTMVQNNLDGTVTARPDGQSDLYGRFVPGTTGKLTIDNVAIQ